jgi:OOP family OmpA-OmpF porin
MPSSRPCPRLFAQTFVLALSVVVGASRAEAQQQAQGFAVERLYPSAPGGGWIVMDDLSMRGGLGGGMELSTGYARDPLRIVSADGSRLAVVSDQAFVNFGFAATYDRWRLYLNLPMPLWIDGQGGTIGAYKFTPPTAPTGSSPGVSLTTAPDVIADARIGADVRILGNAKGPFRLGAGAQLLIPSANEDRSEYLTDGTFRAMIRLLAAGDLGKLTYAGQLGVHVRPLDDSPTPGSPQGSELLFGIASGARLPVSPTGSTVFIIGPEFYGASAFRSFLSPRATALEGLLSGRIEGTADDGPQIRVKLGVGAGLDTQFGAPAWRAVFAIELFEHNMDRDKDGVSDSKDACPDTPGIKTKDSRTNGCPPYQQIPLGSDR